MELALRGGYARPSCTEQELVAAVRRGSDGAFEELFSRYRSRITSYVLGMVGDHVRAEDIVQEVFLSALRRLRDTERPIAFKAWIYEIAKNACIDEFRRAKRRQEVPLEPEEDAAGGDSGLLSRHPSPDAAVEAKQRLDDLRGAFHGLSESHHRILVLRELEGRSYDEISEQMGMTTQVVESTLFRARRRLNQEYEELVSGRRCEFVRAVIDAGEAQSPRALGLRTRRQLARHLAHCQPCRRHARLAEVDESLFRAPSLAKRIAALLPIPWLRWRRASSDEEAVSSAGSHSWALTQSLQGLARFADPITSTLDFGRAAIATAAIATAGIGGGLVAALPGHASPPPAAAGASSIGHGASLSADSLTSSAITPGSGPGSLADALATGASGASLASPAASSPATPPPGQKTQSQGQSNSQGVGSTGSGDDSGQFPGLGVRRGVNGTTQSLLGTGSQSGGSGGGGGTHGGGGLSMPLPGTPTPTGKLPIGAPHLLGGFGKRLTGFIRSTT